MPKPDTAMAGEYANRLERMQNRLNKELGK
jgi:hypothetical protein